MSLREGDLADRIPTPFFCMKYFMMGSDGAEYGPYTPEELVEWRHQGRVNDMTILRPEESRVWSFWYELPELFEKEEGPVTFDTVQNAAMTEARNRLQTFTISGGISACMQVLLTSTGVVTGGVLVFLLLYGMIQLPLCLGTLLSIFRWFQMDAVAGLPTYVDEVLVVGGYLLTLLFDLLPMVGFGRLFLNLLQGRPASLSDIFWGFSHKTGRLIGLGILLKLIFMALFWPITLIVGVAASFLFSLPLYLGSGDLAAAGLAGSPELMGKAALGLGVGAICGCLLSSLAYVFFSMAPFLVMEKGMTVWESVTTSGRVVSSRWGVALVYFFIASALSGIGVLLFGVGALATLPFYYVAWAYFYLATFEKIEKPRGVVTYHILINAGVAPGLGTWLQGRRALGGIQMGMALIGTLIVTAGLVSWFVELAHLFSAGIQDAEEIYSRSMPPIIAICSGGVLFILAWLFSILTSFNSPSTKKSS